MIKFQDIDQTERLTDRRADTKAWADTICMTLPTTVRVLKMKINCNQKIKL